MAESGYYRVEMRDCGEWALSSRAQKEWRFYRRLDSFEQLKKKTSSNVKVSRAGLYFEWTEVGFEFRFIDSKTGVIVPASEVAATSERSEPVNFNDTPKRAICLED